MKVVWKEIKKYNDINFEIYNGVAKITIIDQKFITPLGLKQI